jgi:hypothetical protein
MKPYHQRKVAVVAFRLKKAERDALLRRLTTGQTRAVRSVGQLCRHIVVQSIAKNWSSRRVSPCNGSEG